MKLLKIRLVSLFLSGLLLCLGVSYLPSQAMDNAVQQGIERYHAGDLRGAIALWKNSKQVEVQKYLARAYQQVGDLEQAIAQFEAITTHYRQANDSVQVGRMLTEQAQILGDMGQYRKAIVLLRDNALKIAQREPDPLGEAAALGSLGTIYYLQGEYDQSITTLQKSRGIAEKLGNTNYLTAIWNDLGNVYSSLAQRDRRYAQFAQQAQDDQAVQRFQRRSEQEKQTAIAAFETSLKLAQQRNDPMSAVRATLGLALYDSQRSGQIQTTLRLLPNSREKAYALIKLANLPKDLQSDRCSTRDVSPLLNQARSIAQSIQDPATESFAIGLLGHQLECAKNYTQALNLTYQAELLAANDETQYLWQWQAGRILRAQGKTTNALTAYEQTINTLKKIQGNIAAANRDLRLDFQQDSEAIYRQLATFRLQQAEQTKLESDQQTQLTFAVEALDGLRLAELRNYLGSQCEIPVTQQSLTAINANTAIFQSIVLDDRILIVLILPESNGKSTLKLHQISIDRTTAIATINTFRQRLEQRSDRENQFQQQAQEIYKWFITPFKAELRSIKTLVFIQDDILRTVPMAALSDGKKFLVQQYAIANTSSLLLPRTQSQPDYNLQILAFGLTQPSAINQTTAFSSLESVKAEIDGIQKVIPDSDGLIDQDFTRDRLQKELKKDRPRILHLATHARFGFDARETFLVTGREPSQQYNDIVSMNELYQLLRSDTVPLELLTLTGCETAAGSSRDALGIAGVAVQAGAQSAIASLWQVDDTATAQLIIQFYRNLQTGQSKSEALQAAQRSWLATNSTGRYQHPGYWAAFVLVGNWL
jgi:CHAT domain-containing protein/tetratricopeptide (TPR) repeat protein